MQQPRQLGIFLVRQSLQKTSRQRRDRGQMLAQKMFYSDGIFASAFHQDPRYYRIASGSIVHRSLLSARQAFVRRSDDGVNQFNYSGIVGRAASAATVLGYYPSPSRTAKVVGLTFATSIASDMGGNLVLEFLPNIIRKFPVMQKLRLE